MKQRWENKRKRRKWRRKKEQDVIVCCCFKICLITLSSRFRSIEKHPEFPFWGHRRPWIRRMRTWRGRARAHHIPLTYILTITINKQINKVRYHNDRYVVFNINWYYPPSPSSLTTKTKEINKESFNCKHPSIAIIIVKIQFFPTPRHPPHTLPPRSLSN